VTVNYFAYGSNLLFARLHARTPSIRSLGVARLPNHCFSFDKIGGDGSGKCGIEQTNTGHEVIGVLYQMDKLEKPVLDKIEGVGHGYVDRQISVVTQLGIISAFTYYPTLVEKSRQPFDWYKALVLEGARENEFPRHYVAMIESIDCVIDPDNTRRTKNLEIVLREKKIRKNG
jgi:gamma-glutamylcyclotransferase